MKFITLLTLLCSLSVASSAKIPSRKVAAPTNPEYVVPAPSPTTSNNNVLAAQPTAAKVPSRNVMPPTSSSSARTTVVSKAVPEPVRPKIMSPPVSPLPQTTIEEDLPVLSVPQKDVDPVVVAATTTEDQPQVESQAEPVVEESVVEETVVEESVVEETVVEEPQSKVAAAFPIPGFTAAGSEDTLISSALQDSEVVTAENSALEAESTAVELVVVNDEIKDVVEPASAPDVMVPQLPALITTTAQEPTAPEVVVHEEPTCDNSKDCNNDTTSSTDGKGDVIGQIIDEEEILIVSVQPRRR